MSYYDPSIMGEPGLTVYPVLSLTSPTIWLKQSENKGNADKIQSLLKPYGNQNSKNEDHSVFNIKDLGPCAAWPYSYEGSMEEICIYLMINKVLHWTPQCYNNSLNLPFDMPYTLRRFIQNLYARNPHEKKNYIWLSCAGEREVDRDRLGFIEYYPQPAFSASFFPYRDKSDDMPIVAVRLHDIQPHILIAIRCSVYTEGSSENHYTTFQIYRDI